MVVAAAAWCCRDSRSVDKADGEVPSMRSSSPHRSGYCKSTSVAVRLNRREGTDLTNMKLVQTPEPCSAVFSVTLPLAGSGPIEDLFWNVEAFVRSRPSKVSLLHVRFPDELASFFKSRKHILDMPDVNRRLCFLHPEGKHLTGLLTR